MKVFKIGGKEYQLRNKSKEVSLNEFAKISHILSGGDGETTDKWLEVLTILGSKELTELLTLKQFSDAVQSCNLMDVNKKVKQSIEVNGRVYECTLSKGEIQLTAKDLSKIEKMATSGKMFGHLAFALVYKDTQLTNEEHYTDAHIEHKAKLFGNQITADIAAPAIIQIGRLIMQHFQTIIDAKSKSVQASE